MPASCTRRFLTAAVATGLGACPYGGEPLPVASKRTPPLDGPLLAANGLNLIVPCGATTRSDRLGFYAGTAGKTPHLEALARQSGVFEDS